MCSFTSAKGRLCRQKSHHVLRGTCHTCRTGSISICFDSAGAENTTTETPEQNYTNAKSFAPVFLSSSNFLLTILIRRFAVILLLYIYLHRCSQSSYSSSLVNGAPEASDLSSPHILSIDAQGEKVRKLQAEGSEKSVWHGQYKSDGKSI